ncbi:MAG: hypothetical protein KUG75_12290 [Pseudomonadales bacterium]|nr:hypothetical protein [Pseudomonadales bacterium]
MGPFSRIISNPIMRWLGHTRPLRTFPLSDFDRMRYELRPGDVILLEGRSHVADVIRAVTNSPWTHAAMYIGKLHDIEDSDIREMIDLHCTPKRTDQLIVESQLGLGTVVRALQVYRGEHLRICRPKGIHYQDVQKILNYAVHQLGKPYNVRQILDLLRFLLPWAIFPRRWRSSLFQHNAGYETKQVCSTMIAEAFGKVQFPILPLMRENDDKQVKLYRRNPKLCTPSDFDYSPYFEIIKYPFWDVSEPAAYRDLPWSVNSDWEKTTVPSSTVASEVPVGSMASPQTQAPD